MKLAMTVALAGFLMGCSDQSTHSTSSAAATSNDVVGMVKSKLAAAPQLSQVEVSADSVGSQITLSGSASSEEARNDAVNIAKGVSPNSIVIDNITVNPGVTSLQEYTIDMAREARDKAKVVGDKIGESLDDAWIYTKIEAKLAGNSTTPALKIHVDVVKKVVTLRGKVGSRKS
jgi:hyperosmotically inducible periplasmic protein